MVVGQAQLERQRVALSPQYLDRRLTAGGVRGIPAKCGWVTSGGDEAGHPNARDTHEGEIQL